MSSFIRKNMEDFIPNTILNIILNIPIDLNLVHNKPVFVFCR